MASAIIPTRNRPRLLARALDSVLSQDVNVEVIIVDEASDPPVSSTIPAHPQVCVIRHEQAQGPAAARNRGCEAATTDIIAFLDDDDYWLPGKLEAVLGAIAQFPEAGLFYHYTGRRRRSRGSVTLLEDPVRRMTEHQPPHLDGVVVRKSVHDRVRFDEGFGAAEDLDYLVRVSQAAPVVELEAVLAGHGTLDADGTDIGLMKRIEGRQQFHQRHQHLLDSAAAQSFYEVRLGHLYRAAGMRREALRAFWRAVRAAPRSPYAWKGVVTALLPRTIVQRIGDAVRGV